MNNVAFAPAPPAPSPQQAQQQAQAMMDQAAAAQQLQPVVPAYAPSNNAAYQTQAAQAQYDQAQAAMAANGAAAQMAAAAAAVAAPANNAPQTRPLHTLPCTRCGHPNCDVQLSGCHCLLHVRCAPVPLRACPNPQCFNSHAALGYMGTPAGGPGGQSLELLPMEFAELDEARRVADLAAKASWRAKEKSRARKKARLEGGGASSSGGSVDSKEMESPPPPSPSSSSSDLRTGRWTTEETAYCDKLIQKFMAGRLPLPEGIKLNEFLSSMLKSKQSRLTKKMKNAKLSSKTFKRTSGHLADVLEARDFSEAEDGFFHSIQNGLERAEIKFHMQKEWRETFSTYCVSHGQPLNVDRWLASVEEMERRVHRAKDAERMQRRKLMMGHALSRDSQNPDRGVVIEEKRGPRPQPAESGPHPEPGQYGAAPDPMASSLAGDPLTSASGASPGEAGGPQSPAQSVASPFLHRIMAFIHRHQVPFEYVDAWVPSFVPDANEGKQPAGEAGPPAGASKEAAAEAPPKCRLCFAGSMVARQVVLGDPSRGQARRAVPLSADDRFNLSAFGEYSESFSFDVGCGLPGRVYHMGVPTWEQSVHNAPLHHFERVGGSQQWGIRTVVGIPVPSPNVGRIVVVLYSRHDRGKDHDLVIRLTEELARLMPSPKWKLVVDVGQREGQAPPPTHAAAAAATTTAGQQPQQQMQSQPQPAPQGQNMDLQPQQQQQQEQPQGPPPEDPAALTAEVISIFGEHMPSDPSSPAFAYLQGFMSLRLLLLRPARSPPEQDVVDTVLSSYASYKAGGRARPDIALMLARDFMFLSQARAPQQPQVQMQQPPQPPPPQPNGGQFPPQAHAPAPTELPPPPPPNHDALFSPGAASTGSGTAMPPPSMENGGDPEYDPQQSQQPQAGRGAGILDEPAPRDATAAPAEGGAPEAAMASVEG
ncbi:hypothetical protein ACHAXT_013162 [Thalassiosira profunda]